MTERNISDTSPNVSKRSAKTSRSDAPAAARGSQVLLDIRHGGHVSETASPGAVAIARQRADVTLVTDTVAGATAPASTVGAAPRESEEVVFTTRFDYLFPELTDDKHHLPTSTTTVNGLNALGDAMVEDPLPPGDNPLQATGNSTIPTVYTYWGQFIDHDLTANTDRDSAQSDIVGSAVTPIPPAIVANTLKNLRQPTVNLDSVYGDGPTFDPGKPTQAGRMYDGIKLRVGKVFVGPGIQGVPIPPNTAAEPEFDSRRDVPRIGALIDEGVLKKEHFPPKFQKIDNFAQTAFIADARNDENLILAQLHTAFLRFHNAVVDWVKENEGKDQSGHAKSDEQLFYRAQQLTRWHYQWLVVNDFLKTITAAGVVDQVLLGGPKFYTPRNGEPYMPLEFSVAAYRFGHTMVRAAYDHNRNFGRAVEGQARPPLIDSASFDLLFAFTGGGSTFNAAANKITLNPFLGGARVLPFNWIIEWPRFVDKGSAIADHFSRKIDTQLAPPLRDLVNQGNDIKDEPPVPPLVKIVLKRLARRNLLRGYILSLPTGQSVAAAMGVEPLTADELRQGNTDVLNGVLEDHGFLQRTPLWFYVLKEAEVRANGNSLGEMGSRIVCETIIGQLLNDPESYLTQEGGWDPSKGVKRESLNGQPELIVTIRDFLRFAGLEA
jgi:hypothetical protein